MKRCNRISLDTAGLMRDLSRLGHTALKAEGGKLAAIMKQEVQHTTYGDAPGKPAWRDHMERNIGLIATAITTDVISIDVGYDADGKSDEVRAMIVAHGSGDKVDGGGSPITAGPPGRSVWDGDVASKHPSRAKSTYALPDAFNQQGNQFVEDAMRRMQTQFGNAIDQAFSSMPDSVIYAKVQVDET